MSEGPRTFRDHFVSIYQSAVADLARQMAQEQQAELRGEAPASAANQARETGADLTRAADAVAMLRMEGVVQGAEPVPEGVLAGAADTAKVCASLGMSYLEARLRGDVATAAMIKGELDVSTCDPRWASTIDEYLRYFGPSGSRAQIPYIRAAQVGPEPIALKANARIALIGDWGTGAEPAVRLLEQVREQRPDVLIHLGDIYYSGTEAECAANFRAIIDRVFDRPRSALPVFTLAGNHDMYCGGIGFYGLIAELNPPEQRQRGSFFCLRSAEAGWQILAMDTGLHDYSPFSVADALTFVEADERDWHRARIAEFAGKTILLSHHQLFSAFSGIGKPSRDGRLRAHNERLLEIFRQFQAAGKPIAAWFWGHEHNLCIYEPYLGLERGRCLGHGAVPVFASSDPYAPLEAIADPPPLRDGTRLSINGDVFAHGFAMIELGPKVGEARAEYFQDVNGRAVSLFAETLA